MSRLLVLLLVVSVGLFVWNAWDTEVLAQRPPELNADGVEYLKVNINPTPVPPMVNINPSGQVPRVEVVRMPAMPTPPPPDVIVAGMCDVEANFVTSVGTTITGPIRVAYLNMAQAQAVTFVETANNSFRVTLAATPQLGSGIFLRAGQRLEFGAPVLYSGCRPGR